MELLEKYVDEKLVIKKGPWYYINNENIGQKKKAAEKLEELIKSGKMAALAHDPSPEVKDEELLPVIKPKVEINPAIENTKEIPKNIDDIFAPMAAAVGDIETRKKGGRFRVFVFGIDSRLDKHPLVKKCPYVFRHNDKKRNVRSGNSVYNDGWTVLSKKNIEKDPRTGKPWLAVARDDTPDEDMFTISGYVLCYADKAQYKRKKGKMNMENMLRTSSIADARQETAERMAQMSKNSPGESMQGYMSSNKADQAIVKEQLEKNKNFSTNEAQEYIDNLNSMGTKDQDIEAEVEKMRLLVDSGKVGRTMKDAKVLTIDEL